MRTYLLLLIVLAFTHISAHPYQITFTGSGLSSAVSTVEVQNLTQGTTITLSGTDILELVANIGIEETGGSSGERGLRIYPNPVADECMITFENPQSGRVSVEIMNLAGQLIIREEASLQQGVQTFSAGGLQQGLYVVQVKTSGKQYTNRLISLGSGTDQPFVRLVNNYSINFPHGKLSGTIQMQYNAGEMLLFKGISGNYSRVITLLPTQNQNVDFEFIACMDGDSNHYPVVTIGTQTWMAENLKYLPSVVEPAVGIATIPYYYVYGYNGSDVNAAKATSNYTIFGVLYNWPAAMNGATSSTANPSGVQGVCPLGWHLPSDAEWTELTDYLGGESTAGGKLKETGIIHWNNPNPGATNQTGFTALPGGIRNLYGLFGNIGSYGGWWSATEYDASNAYGRGMHNNGIQVSSWGLNRELGYSVRCVRD